MRPAKLKKLCLDTPTAYLRGVTQYVAILVELRIIKNVADMTHVKSFGASLVRAIMLVLDSIEPNFGSNRGSLLIKNECLLNLGLYIRDQIRTTAQKYYAVESIDSYRCFRSSNVSVSTP